MFPPSHPDQESLSSKACGLALDRLGERGVVPVAVRALVDGAGDGVAGALVVDPLDLGGVERRPWSAGRASAAPPRSGSTRWDPRRRAQPHRLRAGRRPTGRGTEIFMEEPPLSARAFGFPVGMGFLAYGIDPAAPSRMPMAFRWLRLSACGGHPRSQWRVRAGFSPDFPHSPTLGLCASGILPLVGRVNLTKIYTRLGDSGETHLGDMSRVPKTHPRIEAYGEIDELNSHIGVLLDRRRRCPRSTAAWLRRVQNDLFDLGADLSVPEGEDRLRVAPEQVAWLEERCDEVNAELEPLRSFLLPGGTRGRGAAPRLPDGVPARRAPGAARRGREPRGRPLPQPPLRPALHPRARRERRRRGAALGARREPLSRSGRSAAALAAVDRQAVERDGRVVLVVALVEDRQEEAGAAAGPHAAAGAQAAWWRRRRSSPRAGAIAVWRRPVPLTRDRHAAQRVRPRASCASRPGRCASAGGAPRR